MFFTYGNLEIKYIIRNKEPLKVKFLAVSV